MNKLSKTTVKSKILINQKSAKMSLIVIYLKT